MQKSGNMFRHNEKLLSSDTRQSMICRIATETLTECIGTTNWSHLGPIRRILSRVIASGYTFWLTFRTLSEVLYFDEWRTKKSFSVCLKVTSFITSKLRQCEAKSKAVSCSHCFSFNLVTALNFKFV